MTLQDVEKTDTQKPQETVSLFKPLNKVTEGEGAKIMIYGMPETGKTYFSLSCPAPIYVMSTEFGVKKVSHHFKDKEDQIQLVECNVPFAEKLKDRSGTEEKVPYRVDPMASLSRIEDAANEIGEGIKTGDIKPGGTIVLDSISDVWGWLAIMLDYTGEKTTTSKGAQIIRGNEWQKVNEAFRTLVNKFNALPMHVVLTARVKEMRDKDQRLLGKMPKAAKDAVHFVDMVIHTEKKPDLNAAKSGKTVMKRIGKIEKSRYQSMNDLGIEDITFDKIKEHFAKIGMGNVFDIRA